MVTATASSQSLQNASFTAEDAAEIKRLANEINRLQQKVGNSATSPLMDEDSGTATMPRSSSRFGKVASLKKSRSIKKSRSSKKKHALETIVDERLSFADDETRDTEEATVATVGDRSVAAISQREDMSLGQKLDLLIFGIDTTKSAADVHTVAPTARSIAGTNLPVAPPKEEAPPPSNSKKKTPKKKTASSKKISLAKHKVSQGATKSDDATVLSAASTKTATSKKISLAKHKVSQGATKSDDATVLSAASTKTATSKKISLAKHKLSRGPIKSDDATIFSTESTEAPKSTFCFDISKSLDEATYEASRARSEIDRLIYEHAVYLDRVITKQDATGEEESQTDAFEVLPLDGDEVRIEESTYQREPVLIESAINDVRAVYQEGAEEVSRLCRNQSLIAKHLVKKSVGHLFPPQKKAVNPKRGPAMTKQNSTNSNGPPIAEITFESDDSLSADVNEFQQIYASLTKSYAMEDVDDLNPGDGTDIEVNEGNSASATLREHTRELAEASPSIEDDSIMHLLSHDAEEDDAKDEEKKILGPALEEDDEARAGAEMDIEVERQIIEDICKELKEMEEEAKRAKEQQRLKQEEYERAARALEEDTKRRELEEKKEVLHSLAAEAAAAAGAIARAVGFDTLEEEEGRRRELEQKRTSLQILAKEAAAAAKEIDRIEEKKATLQILARDAAAAAKTAELKKKKRKEQERIANERKERERIQHEKSVLQSLANEAAAAGRSVELQKRKREENERIANERKERERIKHEKAKAKAAEAERKKQLAREAKERKAAAKAAAKEAKEQRKREAVEAKKAKEQRKLEAEMAKKEAKRARKELKQQEIVEISTEIQVAASLPGSREKEEQNDVSFTVKFAPGPLGMKLESLSLVNDGGTVKEIGCHVLGFSEKEANQARDSGQIRPSDVLIEVDGESVEGREYSHVISLLKKQRTSSNGESIGKSVKFRRPTVGEKVEAEVHAIDNASTKANSSESSAGRTIADMAPAESANVDNIPDQSEKVAVDIVCDDTSSDVDSSSDSSVECTTTSQASEGEAEEDSISGAPSKYSGETYAAHFNPGPLGMILEPMIVLGGTDGARKECGCHVRDFSKSAKSQAFDTGVIGIGDVIVEIDGTDVSAEDYLYASIIDLLKQKSGNTSKGKTITFRRGSLE